MDIVTILSIATAIEGFTKYVFGESGGMTRRYLPYVTLLLGVAAAFLYQINIPEMLGLQASYVWVDYVVTGLIIGRGSNYTNDIIKRIRG